MKHPATRELYAYWARLRGGRAAPERSDIDPAAIRTILSDTFILEVDNDQSIPLFPVRLSGTRLNALFLRELKGQSFPAIWADADRSSIHRLLETVVDNCEPVVAGLRTGPDGHRPIDLEMLLLPLRHRGRTHARLLGSIAPIEVPSWLGLLATAPLSLSSIRVLGHVATDVPTDTMCDVLPSGRRRYGAFVVHQGGR